MNLVRTRFALERSHEVIASARLEQDVFVNFIVEYILIVFCSEMEECIKLALEKMLKKNCTPETTFFINNIMASVIKRIDKKDLAETLSRFSLDRKERFSTSLDDSLVTKYMSFITNRHNVAHSGRPIETSWRDIQEIADVGEAVLKAFYEALDLTPSDLQP